MLVLAKVWTAHVGVKMDGVTITKECYVTNPVNLDCMVSVVNLLAEIVWKELSVLQKMAFVQMVATNQVSTILASTIKSANITNLCADADLMNTVGTVKTNAVQPVMITTVGMKTGSVLDVPLESILAKIAQQNAVPGLLARTVTVGVVVTVAPPVIL